MNKEVEEIKQFIIDYDKLYHWEWLNKYHLSKQGYVSFKVGLEEFLSRME